MQLAPDSMHQQLTNTAERIIVESNSIFLFAILVKKMFFDTVTEQSYKTFVIKTVAVTFAGSKVISGVSIN